MPISNINFLYVYFNLLTKIRIYLLHLFGIYNKYAQSTFSPYVSCPIEYFEWIVFRDDRLIIIPHTFLLGRSTNLETTFLLIMFLLINLLYAQVSMKQFGKIRLSCTCNNTNMLNWLFIFMIREGQIVGLTDVVLTCHWNYLICIERIRFMVCIFRIRLYFTTKNWN